MEKRKVLETLKQMYIGYLHGAVSGNFRDTHLYENDFLLASAVSVNNLHQNGYKVS